MGRKFWQTRAFKDLAKEWEKRLQQSEFIDAESLIKGELVLKQRASNCYRQADALARSTKLRYYELLGVCFHKELFASNVDALIMERRSQGHSIQEISRELKALGAKCHRETVRHIIRRYEVKWGIKT